jgi:hypothetical protein
VSRLSGGVNDGALRSPDDEEFKLHGVDPTLTVVQIQTACGEKLILPVISDSLPLAVCNFQIPLGRGKLDAVAHGKATLFLALDGNSLLTVRGVSQLRAILQHHRDPVVRIVDADDAGVFIGREPVCLRRRLERWAGALAAVVRHRNHRGE